MDRMLKGTTAAPVGAVGAALWVLGSGLSTLGNVTGMGSLKDTGDSMYEAGGSAMEVSRDMAEEAILNNHVRDRNKALAVFGEHSRGTGFLSETALKEMVAEMPELYIGLEGILGSLDTVHSETAALIRSDYADPKGNGHLEWDGFYRFWREVIVGHEARMHFYHKVIFKHYDTDKKDALTEPQVSRLLGDLYYNEHSAFSGDYRLPPKELLMSSIREDLTFPEEGEEGGEEEKGSRVGLAALAPILRGEFSCTALPEGGDG